MDPEQPKVVYVLMPEQKQDNSLRVTSLLSIFSLIVGGAQAIGSVLLYTHKFGFLIGLGLFIIGLLRQMFSGLKRANSLSKSNKGYTNSLVQFGYTEEQV